MSKGGVDIDLNSVQGDTDTPKEVLKQAMLHHEIIFRNQVLELHLLYWTQKNLMHATWTGNSEMTPQRATKNDFLPCHSPALSATLTQGRVPSEQCKSYSSNFLHDQQRSLDLQLPANEYIKVEANGCLEIRSSIGNEIVDVADPGDVELTLGSSKEDSNEKRGAKKTLFCKESHLDNQVVIDLEDHADLIFNKEVNTVSQFGFKIPKTDSGVTYGSHISVPSDLTSSGRTGKESGCTSSSNHSHIDHSDCLRERSSFHFNPDWNESRGHSSMDIFTRKQQSASYKAKKIDLNVTQLEESSDNSDNYLVMIPPSACSSPIFPRGLNESHVNTLPDATSWRETSDKCSKETLITLEVSAAHLASTNSGDKEADLLTYGSRSSLPCSRKFSAKNTKFAQSDWNNDQDEVNPLILRSNSEDQGDLYRKPRGGISGSFDVEVQSRLSGSSPLSPSDFYKLSDRDADLLSGQPGWFAKNDSIIVSSTPGANTEQNNLPSSFESTNASQMLAGVSELKQANHERSKENTMSSSAWGGDMSAQRTMSGAQEEHKDGHFQVVPIGDKPGLIASSNTCIIGDEDIEQSADLSMNEDLLTNQMGLLVTETNSGKQDAITDIQVHVRSEDKSCARGELQPPEHNGENDKDMAEMDCKIWWAAESLVHISLESSASSLDQFTNTGDIELEADERSDQPQCSSDSFESIVLMLKESVDDECSKPIRPTEEKTTKDGRRFKLRRGRGLCDFQKDILPGLVSLSRHEICEDLHVIGEAVRLHELRKGSGKIQKGNWYTPVRGRRSRLNSIGRMQ